MAPRIDDDGCSHYRCELCLGLFPWDEISRHVSEYHRVDPNRTGDYIGEGRFVEP